MVTVVLMHSPFLGPSSMRPLADELASDGVAVLLVDLQMTINEAPVHQRLIGAFADALEDSGVTGPVILVGHSGAGPLLPGFAYALEIDVAGLVFLDSDLPTPGRSWRETVDPALVNQVKASVRDGKLPRWDRWFPEDPLRLVPSELREEMRDEAPQVPWEFLKEQRPTVEWTGACGYVLLSAVYEDQAAKAEALGWPVERVESHHLAAATSPSAVAAAVKAVVSRL
ncbi:alpha/beta fold hydrolase [Lentzea sp. NPDC005914]|uniref:alpha/beta fold hydrolase n=1 Tax=Lentzea sp. NPDC005914 TaxID=3154572 RepID=UPI0033DC864B